MFGRIGIAAVVGLLTAGVFAAPALAASTADLELRVSGTTIAVGAPDKDGVLKILNHGPDDATGVALLYDVSQLDATKVQLAGLDACTDVGGGQFLCGIDPDLVKANTDERLAVQLVKTPAASGAAGAITIAVQHAGTDPTLANNTVTVPVTVSGTGPDLRTLALDVYQESTEQTEPVPAGGTARVWAFVQNQGDATTQGLTATVTLPPSVSFAETLAGCAYNGQTATCTRNDVSLVPAHQDDPENEDDPPSSGWLFWNVKVAAAAKVGALTGGSVSVAPIAVPSVLSAPVAGRVGFSQVGPAGIELDVDPTDNVDAYTVFVGAAVSPSPSPSPTPSSPAPSPSPSPGGGGGSLPITGAPAAGLAATGLAALVAGLALVLLARRRRPTS